MCLELHRRGGGAVWSGRDAEGEGLQEHPESRDTGGPQRQDGEWGGLAGKDRIVTACTFFGATGRSYCMIQCSR